MPDDLDLGGALQRLFSGSVNGLPGALEQYRQGADQSRQQMGDTLKGGVDYYSQRNPDGVNIPMLMFSAGLTAPTRTGSFGESMANGFNAYGGALSKAREADMTREDKLLRLQEAQANLTRQGGTDALDMVTKPLGMFPSIGTAAGSVADARLFGGVPGVSSMSPAMARMPGVATSGGAAPALPPPPPPPTMSSASFGAPASATGFGGNAGIAQPSARIGSALPPPMEAVPPPVMAPAMPDGTYDAPAAAMPLGALAAAASPPGQPASRPAVGNAALPPPPPGAMPPQDGASPPMDIAPQQPRSGQQLVSGAALTVDDLHRRDVQVLDAYQRNPGQFAGPRGQEIVKQSFERIQKSPAYMAAVKGAETGAQKAAEAPYTMLEEETPEGTTVRRPLSSIVAQNSGAQPGGGQSVGAQGQASQSVAKQPASLTEKLKETAKSEQNMFKTYRGLDTQQQRLQHLASVLEDYQPGAFAQTKGDFVAALRSAGFSVPNTATANPAAFQQFIKESTAEVFEQLRTLPGQPRVAEIQGLQKALMDPHLQPEANKSLIGQMMGLVDYQKRYFEDYRAWRNTPQGRNNPNPEDFDIAWRKANPVQNFISQATGNVAVRGEQIPPADKRPIGQTYMTPKGKFRWQGSGWEAVQ